ncbi:hypothetical protein Tco_0156843 [Tanacetum coccineum]
MVEPEKPLKKKDQIKYDQEVNTQAMMKADYQMAQQLHAEEQEQLSIEEKSKLLMELMNKRKKHFVEMRAREKRNKPPTQAQQRKLYFNTFVDYKTELIEESSKRAKAEKESSSKSAGEELESENLKKQKLDENVEAKVDDDQEEAEMKNHMEIVPDDEVAIDAIPLATKSPIIVD